MALEPAMESAMESALESAMESSLESALETSLESALETLLGSAANGSLARTPPDWPVGHWDQVSGAGVCHALAVGQPGPEIRLLRRALPSVGLLRPCPACCPSGL